MKNKVFQLVKELPKGRKVSKSCKEAKVGEVFKIGPHPDGKFMVRIE